MSGPAPAPWTEEELLAHVEDAVELELFTIPAYLTAYYSIDQARSKAAADGAEALRAVVNEEMMHLQQLCNLSNALGRGPCLTGPSAPGYPRRVPYHRHDVEIALGPATKDQLERFMAIELPTSRDPYASASGDLPPQPAYETIGEFYHALIHGLGKVYGPGGTAWPTGANQQVTGNFTDDTFPIVDLASAVRALELVVLQGEGASADDPHDDDPGELAHYYQLQAIAGSLGPGDLRPMVVLTAGLPHATRQGALLDFFDACYSRLLRDLEASFNGGGAIGPAVGAMWAVVNALASYLVGVPYLAADGGTPTGSTLAPRFRYTETSPEDAYPQLDAEDRGSEAVQGVASALKIAVG